MYYSVRVWCVNLVQFFVGDKKNVFILSMLPESQNVIDPWTRTYCKKYTREEKNQLFLYSNETKINFPISYTYSIRQQHLKYLLNCSEKIIVLFH